MAKYVGFKIGKVHESHVISEYYCGGCGWPVTDHDSFCPECGGAFRECDADDLESENAKLRKTLGEYECKMDALVDSLTGGLLSKSMDTPNDSIEDAVREHVEGNLATENARLSDLAYAMWDWMGRARYDGAIRCDEMDEIGKRAVGLGLLAHELGIEVDCRD